MKSFLLFFKLNNFLFNIIYTEFIFNFKIKNFSEFLIKLKKHYKINTSFYLDCNIFWSW
jgi:hypothetical protein